MTQLCESENDGCRCHRCECHVDEEGDTAGKMFHLAKCAKFAVLKKKMELKLEERMGSELDQIAELAVGALLDSLRRRSAKKAAGRQYVDDIITATRYG